MSFPKKQKNIQIVTSPEIFERLFKGSMPTLYNGVCANRNEYYSDYIGAIVERYFKELISSVKPLEIYNFITAVSARTSQLVNYKSIADDCDLDQVTVKSWLRILETLGIIFYLHPYSNNVLKRTIKTPKLYFYDTGLVCYLTKWSSAETVMNGAMNGALLENYAVSEILKSYQNVGREAFIYYYRDKDTKEIDLILEKDGVLYPVEIKKTATPDKKLTRVFNVIDKLPLIKGTGAILCMAERLSAFDSDNLIIPISLL